jgi:hypothetical protein
VADLRARSTTLQVLGTTIGVPAEIAGEFRDLPRTDRNAVATVAAGTTQAVLTELTRLAIDNSPLLCIHAGVISASSGYIAFPGPSGLGKTTLVATLVRGGFGYVSDESLAIDRATGRAQPFARPLALSADVWSLLGPGVGDPPSGGTEGLIQASALGRVERADEPVRHIVLARRRPGPARIVPANRGDAVVELLHRSFNHFRAPESSFRSIVAVVRTARVWHACYQDARDMIELLPDTLGVQAIADTAAK